MSETWKARVAELIRRNDQDIGCAEACSCLAPAIHLLNDMEAALEALEAEVAKLREALEPFGEAIKRQEHAAQLGIGDFVHMDENSHIMEIPNEARADSHYWVLQWSDFIRARASLGETK